MFVLVAWPCLAAERTPWLSSRVKGTPGPAKPYRLERIYPQLQFEQPVELMPLSNTGRMLLLEVGGGIYTFEDRDDCRDADLALELSGQIDNFDRALGIAPHPQFENNRQVFVCYAAGPVARPDGTRLSRFTFSLEPKPRIIPESEEILLTWPSGGHNGCAIRFDSRGLLYFSAGDGARPYPPDEYDVSQDLSDLRATICRIDVDHPEGDRLYSIPQDNPFVKLEGARPEIWAYGFRNPWRFSIDPATDQLICGDVGWELWEMIFDVKRGGNYGWSLFEGPQPIRSDIQRGPTPITKPIIAYPHTQGLSVTGGFTYRGTELPELTGAYLYGDFMTGLVWGLRFEDGQASWNEILAQTGLKVITFAQDRTGEPLVVSYGGGIYRLRENLQPKSEEAFPTKLSQTGLFESTVELTPAAGVYTYGVNVLSYEEVDSRSFVIGVPGDATITTARQQRGWKYPRDTVFAKTLSRRVMTEEGQRLQRMETQLLHFDGLSWLPYSYAWNAEQTDAFLVGAEGKEQPLATNDGTNDRGGGSVAESWQFLSRNECRACHTNQAGGAVAFTFANLDRPMAESDQNQIEHFVELGLIDRLPPPAWNTTAMVAQHGVEHSLERRARSYLAANCAHCHCRGGGGTVALDLTFANSLEEMNAIDFPVTQGDFGIDQARVIAAGAPLRSILLYRLATAGQGHMPKIWARDNDSAGIRLVHDWIASLGGTLEAQSTVEGEQAIRCATSQALARALELDAIPDPRQRADKAKQELKAANVLTRGLFERLLPHDQRAERIGSRVDRQRLANTVGDAQRGRERFLNSPGTQCRNCHRLQGKGQKLGPDLDGIGKKRSREQLLTSLLSPSESIEEEFRTLNLLTSDGVVIQGLIESETSDSLTIRSSEQQIHQIDRADIEELQRTKTSMMPTGLVNEMTYEELADCLEFLLSL